MTRGQPEAFSRLLIDKALEASGWNLLDTQQVSLEVSSTTGRSDYILKDDRGFPICILEAKREDKDPYDAKEQARGYAENLKAPFIILSNGVVHYFWNFTRKDREDAYRIEQLPSRTDLERLKLKNLQPPRPLLTERLTPSSLAGIDPDLKLRGYQIHALDEVAKQFDEAGRRKFLLEMATGTGKTLMCAALIRRFLMTRNAERVLFVVDRIELAKQTLETFEFVLRDYKPVIFKTARHKPAELMASSVVIATIQSLLVDRRYREVFTPYHFDLVINDEAHRSIYGDAREVLQFFQATRVGLTATPKAYLKNIDLTQLAEENPKGLEARQLRDTYHYFGCEPGLPTYRYDIVDAVKDPEGPFLCLPKIWDIRSEITTKALEEGGWTVTVNEQEESFKIRDLERKIFTPERNKLICEQFFKNALRAPDGKIGRTIIFAVNQTHATTLTKMLNAMQPEIAITITSRIPEAAAIAKDFRDGKREERVAVSVDMLSTGYNCTDILNIVLARPIFSPTEYIQIKGRGTRLHTFKVGNTAYKKENYLILDFCGVAEYFEDKYDYTVPLNVPRIAKDSKAKKVSTGEVMFEGQGSVTDPVPGDEPKPEIPIWSGTDIVQTTEVKIVGPDGEKVDVMTFRGSYEKDIKELYKKDGAFKVAVDGEDDDMIETIMSERFFNRPNMFYTPGKLVQAYGVPAPTPTFVYGPLGKKEIPTKERIVEDTVETIAAQFNLRFNDQRWVDAIVKMLVDDKDARRRFNSRDMTIFNTSQFNALGGLEGLLAFNERDNVFEALRLAPIVRQADLAEF